MLGFDVVFEARDVPGWGTTGDILFLAAGGYHHHLGFNTWKSAGGGPQPDGVTGLHHVALNYSTRAALGDAVRRLRDTDWPLRQVTDHGTHLAIYISDPDGNDLDLPGTARSPNGRATTAATRWRCSTARSTWTRWSPRRARADPRSGRPVGVARLGAARGEAGEEPRQQRHLVGLEVVEEAPLDVGEVGGLSLTREPQAGVGEVSVDRAGVARARATLDQGASLERVDDPRHAAEAQPGVGGQLAHSPQAAVVRRGQATEQLDRAHRELVAGLQLLVERAVELAMGLQEPDPRLGVGVRPARQAIVAHHVGADRGDGIW